MVLPAVVEGDLLADLVALALGKPLYEWRRLSDEEIEIPEPLTRIVAYYRYLDRGCVHGYDLEDYYRALADLRDQLRLTAEQLQQAPRDDSAGVLEETNGVQSDSPNNADEQEAHVANGGIVQEGEIEQVTHNKPRGEVDRFGNLWTSDRPVRAEMSHEMFSERFEGYRVVLVEVTTDRVIAAGVDKSSLVKGLADRKLDVSAFQVEPGPFTVPLEVPRASGSK
jgi:hypothetical protein